MQFEFFISPYPTYILYKVRTIQLTEKQFCVEEITVLCPKTRL